MDLLACIGFALAVHANVRLYLLEAKLNKEFGK